MREAGIDKGAVSGRKANSHVGIVDNARIQGLTETYPDYFIGLAGVDPLDRENTIHVGNPHSRYSCVS